MPVHTYSLRRPEPGACLGAFWNTDAYFGFCDEGIDRWFNIPRDAQNVTVHFAAAEPHDPDEAGYIVKAIGDAHIMVFDGERWQREEVDSGVCTAIRKVVAEAVPTRDVNLKGPNGPSCYVWFEYDAEDADESVDEDEVGCTRCPVVEKELLDTRRRLESEKARADRYQRRLLSIATYARFLDDRETSA